MRFYTTEHLSEKQSLTPEGFLLCQDVPIARTGEYIYGPNQTTLPTGPDGLVHIRRTDGEVFRPETITSFEGKPFVLDHPDQPDPDRWTVDPYNWATVAKGHIIGPHRGGEGQEDLLMADVLVTDSSAIQEIRNGRREVSCGYIADYLCDECGKFDDRATWNKCVCHEPRGWGQQIGIIGNHVALVDSGRCGARCAIGDRAVADSADGAEGNAMKWLETLKAAWTSKDHKAFDAALADVPSGKRVFITKDGICDADEEEEKKETKAEAKDWADAAAELEKRADKTDDALDRLAKDVGDIKDELFKFKKTKDEEEEEKKKETEDKDKDDEESKETEDQVAEEAKAGTGDRARRAHDSALLEDSFQETIALAEILSPGFRIPTFDRSDMPARTAATICRTRRAVLDLAYGQAEMRGVIDDLLHGVIPQPSFVHDKSMTCDTVRFVFRAAGLVKKQRNNEYKPAATMTGVGGGTGVRGIVKTPADFNRRMQEYWKDR